MGDIAIYLRLSLPTPRGLTTGRILHTHTAGGTLIDERIVATALGEAAAITLSLNSAHASFRESLDDITVDDADILGNRVPAELIFSVRDIDDNAADRSLARPSCTDRLLLASGERELLVVLRI